MSADAWNCHPLRDTRRPQADHAVPDDAHEHQKQHPQTAWLRDGKKRADSGALKLVLIPNEEIETIHEAVGIEVARTPFGR